MTKIAKRNLGARSTLLRSTLLRTTVALCAISVSGMASAQENASPPPAPDIATQDIIVTAQRRDESLSKTPVAITVLSADTLAKAQVVSEQDLRFATPGLSVRASNNSNQLNYSLRGQSKDAFSGAAPGVLPYINEVQIGGDGGSTAFYDLQSVQVLKGPQGTLFGRSATGGAVLFTTAKPTDQFGGFISGSYGNYNAIDLQGAVNAPLAGDRLMARIAGVFQKRDGFQRNLFDGSREGDLERYGARASLTANFGDRIHNELVLDYLHQKSESTVGVLSGLTPFNGGGPGNPPFIPIAYLYAGTATPVARATGIATLQGFTGVSASVAAAYYDAYFANPSHPANGIGGQLLAQQARGPYVVDDNSNNQYRADNILLTNATTLELNDSTKLKNVIGYNHSNTLQALDSDGTSYDLSSLGPKPGYTGLGQPQRFYTRQFSEELQLLGKAFVDRLDYVVGGYYSNDSLRTRQTSGFFDLLFGGQQQTYDYTIKNRTLAAYAQGTFKLNDSGLSATLGTRYTSERAQRLTNPADTIRIALGDPAPTGYSYNQSKTYNRVSWTIGLQDQVDPNLLIYAVSRRAYKSGGFNGALPPKNGDASTAGDSFAAERVTDVELGMKYKGRVADIPTRLTLALFHDWISDDQRTGYTVVNGGPATVTVNVPRARNYGAELELQAQPMKWLSIGGTFNYIHARFTDGIGIANGAPLLFNQVPDTPKVSGLFFADVTIPVSDQLNATLHGDLYGQTETFTSPNSGANDAGNRIDGYRLANFRIAIEQRDAGWSLTANVKNAFNRVYYVGGIPTGDIYQINLLVPGQPRTFTVEARLKF